MNAGAGDLQRIGMSPRRVSYWTAQGWLVCVAHPGSGFPMEWPPSELLVAAYMMVLVDAGLTPAAAARAARAHGQIAPGVRVDVSLPAGRWEVVAEVYHELVSAAPSAEVPV